MSRNLRIGAILMVAVIALGIGSVMLDRVKAASVMAPRFEVDPLWPKPLPNHWVIGNAIGRYLGERQTAAMPAPGETAPGLNQETSNE